MIVSDEVEEYIEFCIELQNKHPDLTVLQARQFAIEMQKARQRNEQVVALERLATAFEHGLVAIPGVGGPSALEKIAMLIEDGALTQS